MGKNVQRLVPPTDRVGEPLLIGAETVAEMLGVSTRTVWRLLSAGKFVEPLRLGGSVRWRLYEVEEWVEKGCPVPSGRENGISPR